VSRVAVCLCLVLGTAAIAAAPDDAPAKAKPEPLAGNVPAEPETTPPWPAHGVPPVSVWDVVAGGALGIGVALVQFGLPQPTQPKWTGGDGFDDWARRGLRIHGEGGRKAAALTSDVLVYTLSAFPFLNAVLVAGFEYERPDVAWRLVALDAETLLTVTFVALSLQHITLRERPFAGPCTANPTLSDCSVGGKFMSFPSAHTTVVFAAVALECFHHGYLDTSHTGWGAAACPATIAAATVTGILRVASDRHWATDVIAGAVIGGTLGYAIPALHLAAAGESSAVLVPSVSPSQFGVTLAGRF
jgi:membrane-associated phospholipid phosphatase